MHEKLRQKEQTLDFNAKSQHGYRAQGSNSIHHVIKYEMSIGQFNMYSKEKENMYRVSIEF